MRAGIVGGHTCRVLSVAAHSSQRSNGGRRPSGRFTPGLATALHPMRSLIQLAGSWTYELAGG